MTSATSVRDEVRGTHPDCFLRVGQGVCPLANPRVGRIHPPRGSRHRLPGPLLPSTRVYVPALRSTCRAIRSDQGEPFQTTSAAPSPSPDYLLPTHELSSNSAFETSVPGLHIRDTDPPTGP